MQFQPCRFFVTSCSRLLMTVETVTRFHWLVMVHPVAWCWWSALSVTESCKEEKVSSDCRWMCSWISGNIVRLIELVSFPLFMFKYMIPIESCNEIINEMQWNSFKIISVFYFTCNHMWNWNKIISAVERVLKLFQNYFADTEHVGKYSWAAIILWIILK